MNEHEALTAMLQDKTTCPDTISSTNPTGSGLGLNSVLSRDRSRLIAYGRADQHVARGAYATLEENIGSPWSAT
jgi:hypothetical protein